MYNTSFPCRKMLHKKALLIGSGPADRKEDKIDGCQMPERSRDLGPIGKSGREGSGPF